MQHLERITPFPQARVRLVEAIPQILILTLERPRFESHWVRPHVLLQQEDHSSIRQQAFPFLRGYRPRLYVQGRARIPARQHKTLT